MQGIAGTLRGFSAISAESLQFPANICSVVLTISNQKLTFIGVLNHISVKYCSIPLQEIFQPPACMLIQNSLLIRTLEYLLVLTISNQKLTFMGVLYYISVKYCGKPFEDMTSTSPIAVRCCSNDDCGTCESVCSGRDATFSEAKQKCSQLGMRLCTKKELASEICCGTGCGFDNKYVWYAPEGNVFRSINPIPSEPYIYSPPLPK